MEAPALVVLAAGASRRLGEPKALVDLGGQTAIERLLAAGEALDDRTPLVITGADHAPIRAALEGLRVELAHNPDWAAGRTGGVRLAQGLRPGRDLCVAPVDAPLITRATFSTLRARWAELGQPPRGWLAPCTSGGVHGHPILIGRELAATLPSAPPDQPLRVLRAAAEPLEDVSVEDVAILDNLDTPADRKSLRRRVSDPTSERGD